MVALNLAMILYHKPEVAACIQQASDEARRLCGARQRLALAKFTLASVEAPAELGELPYDLLRHVFEMSALGLPAVRVVFRAAADIGPIWKTERGGSLLVRTHTDRTAAGSDDLYSLNVNLESLEERFRDLEEDLPVASTKQILISLQMQLQQLDRKMDEIGVRGLSGE